MLEQKWFGEKTMTIEEMRWDLSHLVKDTSPDAIKKELEAAVEDAQIVGADELDGQVHRAAQALAFTQERAFVIPDDIKALTVPVIAHRVVLDAKAKYTGTAKREIISEIARCLNVPRNVAACDSSDYNYASGRLDHQTYFKSIEVEREDLERVVLNPLFRAWMQEARRVTGLLPVGGWLEEDDPHAWMWRGMAEIDPRWVRAEKELVLSGLITEAEYHARRGRDWSDVHLQKERERESRRRHGLPDLLELVARAGETHLEIVED